MKEKIKKIFSKVFGYMRVVDSKVFGYMGIVDTQISIYNTLKKAMPELSENEILNKLILSRIKTLPRIASKEEEKAHYKPLLDNSSKTLENVIWEIIFFEFFENRTNELLKKKIPPEAITTWISEVKQYIKERASKIKPRKRKEKIRKFYINTDNKDDIEESIKHISLIHERKREKKNKTNDIEELIKTISLILDATGVKLNEKDKKMLFSKKSPEEVKDLSDEQKKSLEKFYDNLAKGYILLAIKGYEFTKVDRIEEKFGSTMEENYPEASESFIKFARTYWTFQIHLLEDFTGLRNYLAYSYLADLHAIIASGFFPMPGPATIPSNEREKIQREILKDFDIDIEDFMKGNPILIRDRQRGI